MPRQKKPQQLIKGTYIYNVANRLIPYKRPVDTL